MKAAMFHGPGQPITIEDIPVPECGPDDVLVKVHRCGICGSDTSMTGDAPFVYPPGRLGHEFAGEIVEVGRNLSGWRVGQRVACKPGAPCGECQSCKWGSPVSCRAPRTTNAGTGGTGGFGEYVALHPGCITPLPQSLSFADGAMIEPMACGLHGMKMARIEKGARVLVLGAGAMALSATYWARRLGAARVVVATRSASRREVACAMGADSLHVLEDTGDAELFEHLGGLPDIVVEGVGRPGIISRAMELVRPRGVVMSLGMCMHVEPLVPAIGSFRDASLIFPLAYTDSDFAETARAFDADGIHPEMMVQEVIGLSELPDAIEDLRAGRRGGQKIHVDPFKEG